MTHKAFEIIWLIIIVVCAGIFIYVLAQRGFNESYIWLIWMVIAFLFYMRRRKIRLDLGKER